MNTLDIRVAFSAVDNLTRPATSARESAEALAASLRNTQNNLRDLERQSRSFSSARKHLTEVTDKIKGTQQELNGLQRLQQRILLYQQQLQVMLEVQNQLLLLPLMHLH